MPSGIYNRTEEHNKKIGIALAKEHIIKICSTCKNKFSVQQYRKDTAIFCSRRCRRHNNETKEKMSESKKGKKMFLNHKHSEETLIKISKALIGKYRGINSWNWKGGITPKNKLIRNSVEYYKWRNEILKRDNYTCQKTGKRGGKLIVHHLDNFSQFKDKRFDINNGVTLTENSHNKFHKIYGLRNNTKEQFKSFILVEE